MPHSHDNSVAILSKDLKSIQLGNSSGFGLKSCSAPEAPHVLAYNYDQCAMCKLQ